MLTNTKQTPKLLFYDVETTGLNANANGIHQLTCIAVTENGTDTFNSRILPFDGCIIDDKALEISGTTEMDLMSFPDEKTVFGKFDEWLLKHVIKYDKHDKFHLIGYNNRSFDDQFFRNWWNRHDPKYFGSFFWNNTVDVMVLASDFCMSDRHNMVNFKLHTVAQWFGIKIDESQLHNALYDVQLTKMIYDAIQFEYCDGVVPNAKK